MKPSPARATLTGERFVPDAQRGELNEAEHLGRYLWAAQAIAAGQLVLDAGCGLGYGTAILARAGGSAVGLDVDVDAVNEANERFGDVAGFMVGDLLTIPYQVDSYDCVVCFETIEHLADPERGLDEFRRILRPGGLLLVSSPNRGVYPEGNPFHLHEYTSVELEDSMRDRFSNVRMYRQTEHLVSLICDDPAAAAADPETEVASTVRKLLPDPLGEEPFTIAVASDGEIPALPNLGMLTGALSLRMWVDDAMASRERAQRAQAELEICRAQRHEAQFERDFLTRELAQLRSGRKRG
jgi:SAM-dependent methyltransferase